MGKELDKSPEPVNPVSLFPISQAVAEEAYSALRIGGSDLRMSLEKKFQDHSPTAYSSMLDLHGKSPRHMDSTSLIASINGAAVCFFVLSMQAEKNGIDLPEITSDTFDARNQTIEKDTLQVSEELKKIIGENDELSAEWLLNSSFYIASEGHINEFYDSEPYLAAFTERMFGSRIVGNHAKIRFIEIYYLFKDAYKATTKMSSEISNN